MRPRGTRHEVRAVSCCPPCSRRHILDIDRHFRYPTYRTVYCIIMPLSPLSCSVLAYSLVLLPLHIYVLAPRAWFPVFGFSAYAARLRLRIHWQHIYTGLATTRQHTSTRTNTHTLIQRTFPALTYTGSHAIVHRIYQPCTPVLSSAHNRRCLSLWPEVLARTLHAVAMSDALFGKLRITTSFYAM